MCLDGSPPAYHLHRGSGGGAGGWVLQFEGGGWCNDAPSCAERAGTRRGSTRAMDSLEVFSGLLSNDPDMNPGAKCTANINFQVKSLCFFLKQQQVALRKRRKKTIDLYSLQISNLKNKFYHTFYMIISMLFKMILVVVSESASNII